MSQRLIDANHLIESIKGRLVEGSDGCYMFQCFVDEEPTVDPVKKGNWIYRTDGIFYGMYKCSACRDTVPKPSRYCPMCGAKMDEVTE